MEDLTPQESARFLLKHLTAISPKDGCENDVNLFAFALIACIKRPESSSGFCSNGRGARDHNLGPGNQNFLSQQFSQLLSASTS